MNQIIKHCTQTHIESRTKSTAATHIETKKRATSHAGNLILPIINPIRTKLVTSPWMAKFEKTFLENHNFAIPG